MNREDVDPKILSVITTHLTACHFGEILIFSEDYDRVYTIHYFSDTYCYDITKNSIWFNVITKKYMRAYSYDLHSFITSYDKLYWNSCSCDTVLDKCKICRNKILNHIKENDKFKLILMLE